MQWSLLASRIKANVKAKHRAVARIFDITKVQLFYYLCVSRSWWEAMSHDFHTTTHPLIPPRMCPGHAIDRIRRCIVNQSTKPDRRPSSSLRFLSKSEDHQGVMQYWRWSLRSSYLKKRRVFSLLPDWLFRSRCESLLTPTGYRELRASSKELFITMVWMSRELIKYYKIIYNNNISIQRMC